MYTSIENIPYMQIYVLYTYLTLYTTEAQSRSDGSNYLLAPLKI